MEIRIFRPEDADELAEMIAKTLLTSNGKDYSKAYLEGIIASYSAEHLRKEALTGHVYVACEGERIVGCGAIAPLMGSACESILRTFFVLPKAQGQGIGRRLLHSVEQDEYFLRARRVELHASITAVEFYRKMGYAYKGGIARLDEEQLYRMEKYR